MKYRVWLAGLAVYVMAIAGRTSFGVASPEALGRFDISASQLSLFAVIQLGVYAGSQFPVGLALDRWGSRPVLTAGALILAAGQLSLALAPSLELALAARVLIGAGDATAFTSVIRLVPQWFDARQVPIYTQLTGLIGQTGQVISSLPFAYLLALRGWTTAFVSLAVTGAVISMAAALLVREKDRAASLAHIPMSEATRHPATWLGFWIHFTLGYPIQVFTLMWGVPWMIANGMNERDASALLIVVVIVNVISGPLLGRYTSAHPFRRTYLVVALLVLYMAYLGFLLLESGPITPLQFGILLAILAFTAPGSNIGFDYVRTFIPIARHGTANGVVNQGGFSAGMVACLLIGLALDWSSDGAAYTAHDFRIAFATQYLLFAVGLTGILTCKFKLRRYRELRGLRNPEWRDLLARMKAERAADKARAAREAAEKEAAKARRDDVKRRARRWRKRGGRDARRLSSLARRAGAALHRRGRR